MPSRLIESQLYPTLTLSSEGGGHYELEDDGVPRFVEGHPGDELPAGVVRVDVDEELVIRYEQTMGQWRNVQAELQRIVAGDPDAPLPR